MRALLLVLLLVHGAIHLIGFFRPHGRVEAWLWLATTVLFLATAVLLLAYQPAFWVVAAVAVVLSQVLIVQQWREAWAGTLANGVIALAALVGGATARFEQRVDDEALQLLSHCADRTPVRASELALLPRPVARWLEVSGVVGQPRASTVRLRQRGELRTEPDAAWMPARAVQYFSVSEPGFVWKVDVTMMRVLPVIGRDKYAGGQGFMLIRAGALINVANARGPAIDQGAMLRYLGEIVWFPSAALAPYLAWESIDDSHARATMRHRGLAVSGVFAFDERGRVASFSAERYLGDKLEKWFVPISEWRVIRGVEVPVRGDVVWKLSTGDFNYYRWEILDVEANPTEIY